ncbi:Di-sulfide bridge nucleocytoplasmic transport domain-containing protein [Trichoderma evansii]
MERRTFEAPMEWEYQNTGPVDLTSPFAQVAKKRSDNLFSSSSPAKSTSASGSFSAFGTPSKPPTKSFFTPQLAPKVVAPPFRNPAFTTPRKMDESFSSFTTIAEDSPDAAEISAASAVSVLPNDTSESEHLSDVTTSTVTTPTKIDKASRYNRGSPRKFASGRGEIRPVSRESPRKDMQVLRKRKRHNDDKDVSSVIRHMPPDWEGDASDTDPSASYGGMLLGTNAQLPPHPSLSQQRQQQQHGPKREGWFVSALGTMDRYPGAPDHIYRWLQLGLNCFIIGVILFFGWSVVDAVRSDVRNANEMARMEIIGHISDCRNHYISNECAKNDRPALVEMCTRWYDCMEQDSDAIMRVKVTIKQVADVINEFADAMNLKAWLMFGAIAIFVIFANVMIGWGRSKSHPAPAHPPTYSHVPVMGPDVTPAHFRQRYETPRSQRYSFIEDDTDFDMSTPKALGQGFGYMPAGRRSPSKEDWSASSIKYHRSPNMGY